MKRPNDFTEDSKLVAVRLPKVLRTRAKEFCRREDLTLSQLLRRAVRRELANAAGKDSA
jgi:hypothetical protein